MRQDRDSHCANLGRQMQGNPQPVVAQKSKANGISSDDLRLDAELLMRIKTPSRTTASLTSLSRVEQVMRRNAPDLAGAPVSEIRAAEQRRKAHLAARWPRPRVAALVIILLIAVLQPLAMARLGGSVVVLFLVVSVVIGPERATDGAAFIWRRLLRTWKVELTLVGKALTILRHRVETWSRTAL